MIPYGRQNITEDDIKSVIDVLRSDFLTQGPTGPIFENRLCDYTGAKFSVTSNSCTSALHIACLALGLGKGDIFWTSPISFVASANCGIYCGAKVDFIDVMPDTGLISIESLENKLKVAKQNRKLPKIVIPVHFAGQSCDMKSIHRLSKEYGFSVIEDAAHAIGAKYLDKHVGSCQYSDITVFSFHPVKSITTGEGGAALTNSIDLAEKMKLLRSHGITRDKNCMLNKQNSSSWYYEQVSLGFNYRMPDINAALGISQLNRLDEYVQKRSDIFNWYSEQLSDLPISPLIQKNYGKSSHHLYVIRVLGVKNNRDKIFNHLRNNNISVNLHYIPIYRQPYFKNKIRLLGAEEFYKSVISLPIFPTISKSSLEKIIHNIFEFYE